MSMRVDRFKGYSMVSCIGKGQTLQRLIRADILSSLLRLPLVTSRRDAEPQRILRNSASPREDAGKMTALLNRRFEFLLTLRDSTKKITLKKGCLQRPRSRPASQFCSERNRIREI